ncbi:cyclopropane-fatty-acyl-phospholipid synthase [Thioclava sp. SK-1]|uniref:SAM-dependent methyltransferase n=1 Tax=Thioclava sp. SK-1 TaxID=1889770 RepID=UPI000826B4FA|nr:cyclopropane-fatty-acyl-phospholipid synthase family protein [Thioclava sp. SK-1]OCX66479.1 cyclopropane-fatty-acyl-phospholipid synthase [Thioclava sp. SK-1]
MIEAKVTSTFLTALDGLEYGQLSLTLPDGQTRLFAGPADGPKADLTVHDHRALIAIAARGDVGFTESYRDGLVDTNDMEALMTFALRNEQALSRYINGHPITSKIMGVLYFLNRNTLKGSRRNISAHYDLGNDFYSLWLDDSMTYSSALYDGAVDLKGAQLRKYDRILEQLGASSGRLLEVGCGWGGFAERAMQTGDYALKGLTLSTEQAEFARTRLGPNAQIALQDYRHETGKFDHIVSIEMFEAVGEKYWPTYFAKLGNVLADKGRAMIQTITIDDARFASYRNGADMIRSFVFPGGMLPSDQRFRTQALTAGLRVEDGFAFGQDYARTCREWLANFETKLPEIRAMGFDEGFIRIWRTYLAACIAGFASGRTNVMQYRLAHA